jgi:hypothetical protein
VAGSGLGHCALPASGLADLSAHPLSR